MPLYETRITYNPKITNLGLELLYLQGQIPRCLLVFRILPIFVPVAAGPVFRMSSQLIPSVVCTVPPMIRRPGPLRRSPVISRDGVYVPVAAARRA